MYLAYIASAPARRSIRGGPGLLGRLQLFARWHIVGSPLHQRPQHHQPTSDEGLKKTPSWPVMVWLSRIGLGPARSLPVHRLDRPKRLPSALDRNRRRSGPNARKTPLRTMCRSHRSNATPPIKSSTTIVPIGPARNQFPTPNTRLGNSSQFQNPTRMPNAKEGLAALAACGTRCLLGKRLTGWRGGCELEPV